MRVDDYAAVLVLGGRAPEYLRHDARVLEIVSAFDRAQKWIFGICHGVQILAAAGLVVGKRVTAYENCRWEIEAAGATYVTDEQAVRDGRIVTGQTWQSHPGVLPARLRVPDDFNRLRMTSYERRIRNLVITSRFTSLS